MSTRQTKRPRLALRTAVGRTLVLTLVLAVLIGAGLSLQLAAGRDPSLGPKLTSGAAAQPQTAPGPVAVSVPVQPAPAPVQTSTS